MSSDEYSPISVRPDKNRLQNIMDEVASGSIKIPVFQRDFVWNAAKMIELFDSIRRGYPIGSLLLWRPEIEFKTKKFIGPFLIVKSARNQSYVLDGFQRITTLFGALANPKKTSYEDLNDLKDFAVYYDLRIKEFTFIRGRKYEFNPYLLPLYKAVDTFEFLDFLRDLENVILDRFETNQLIENAKEINKILYDYEIPFVEIRGGDIKSAVEIFSRINSTGTEISQDFMLSALSYNQETNFLLSDYITEFINSLSLYGFENLKRDTVLNCIANTQGKIYFDVRFNELIKYDMERLTEKAFKHIQHAVAFLHDHLFIVDVKLLPYPTQLIFISEFFRINQIYSINQLEALKRWFWITTYSNYFTINSLSQQRIAYRKFVDFAHGQHPSGILENNDDEFVTAKFPQQLNLTSVRSKALQLFLLWYSYEDTTVHPYETIKETFIFNKKDKTPGNILLRLSSDHQDLMHNGGIDRFLNESSRSTLKRFFITPEMVELYNLGNEEQFVELRESIIVSEEAQFVRRFNISYDFTDNWSAGI